MDLGASALGTTTLDSRYHDADRPVLLSGVQALVRLLLEQARRDRRDGLHTAGLVSGYRGSPLGGFDQELWRRGALLAEHDIRFEPGLNEDLAATMIAGTQQAALFGGSRFDGVFGLWYAKGPGVDRSGDALRCANMLGTARHGGVLAVAGDDHGAHSSTYPHQTDPVFSALAMPVLHPADVGDILRLGLAGLALSRFSGLWVALKMIAETAEQTRAITLPSAPRFALPDIALPPYGLNFDPGLRWPAERALLETRLMEERIPAALAWARANPLDITSGAADAPIGLVTVGKAHHDAEHALRLLGLDGDPRIALRRVAMVWPLETAGMAEFARGKRALIVVEEKRPMVETQLRDALYHLPDGLRPAVLGKRGADGARLIPETGELSPHILAAVFAAALRGLGFAAPDAPAPPRPARPEGLLARAPTFCAGCPHNTSTKLPDGSTALAGIGCHIMAMADTDTKGVAPMGGEGAAWCGLAPFSDTPHMFANMGDGTYQHSGLLSIRQAIAARTRITFKILFNDAVAMTGGQKAEGGTTAAAIAHQVAAEGVLRIAYVAEDAERLPDASALPKSVTRHTRDELDAVQRAMRETDGVSVIVYDQVCATEKRRRRKRGTMAKAEIGVAINPRICENCGDCTAQSHCIAIEPIETEYGRKRRISPTSCNTDLSCLAGFCPAFVTGPAELQPAPLQDVWAAAEAVHSASLPAPRLPALDRPWRGLLAGIGGGGIVTTGAVLAMAAHLDGCEVSTLDFTGLAQKNGAVVSHVQIARTPLDIVRIPEGEADCMIAADLAVAASAGVLERCAPHSAIIGNLDLQSAAAFLGARDLRIDAGLHRRVIERAVGPAAAHWLHAGALCERLFGNAQVENTLLLGLAWQAGLLPVSEGALLRAIELNGTAVALNRRAFLWGRILADTPDIATHILAGQRAEPASLDALVAARASELEAYQNAALATRYRALVDRAMPHGEAFARVVAEGYFRVLAYKDEYEVARLHAAAPRAAGTRFHMAPPLITRENPATGRRRKVAVPGWIAMPLFRLLRHGKRLRGTALDPFGWQADRALERRLIAEYEADMEIVLASPETGRRESAIELAKLPLAIRGFGPVKAASAQQAAARRTQLLRELAAPRSIAAE